MWSRPTWSRRAAIACALALLVAAGVLPARPAGEGKALRRTVYAAAFAPGEGRALAERYCQICHAAMLVTQQAKDSTGWEKTLVQMEKWGIAPSAAEHDSLRRYLATSYGPRAR